jgi:hypothetical protein
MRANPKIRNAWPRKRGLNEISGIAQMQRLCRGNGMQLQFRFAKGGIWRYGDLPGIVGPEAGLQILCKVSVMLGFVCLAYENVGIMEII